MITKYNIRKVLFFILLFEDFTIAFLEKAKIFTIPDKYWALSLPFIYLLPFLTLSGIPFYIGFK
ncbi:hypothetical protein [Rice orange leaf phytoplasma]|uniref:Uncharacterized protein n=1 Tax=Maize bushy stunt phytoplasma TaxID=202462 RepID=A0ABM6DLL5_9MOLU|nr:hypothetical protein [Rice orange leaf phytoplasma]AOF54685.1 hypothetical protein MBSPM3_v1c1510 [Maize bushy stunt phytoplasma]OIJ44596.1 hypothetical protein BHE82_02740 [Rice orange leaf phytoplasma]